MSQEKDWEIYLKTNDFEKDYVTLGRSNGTRYYYERVDKVLKMSKQTLAVRGIKCS